MVAASVMDVSLFYKVRSLCMKVGARRTPKLLVIEYSKFMLIHLQNMKIVYLRLILFHPGLVVGREGENFCCKDRKTWITSEKVSLAAAD